MKQHQLHSEEEVRQAIEASCKVATPELVNKLIHGNRQTLLNYVEKPLKSARNRN